MLLRDDLSGLATLFASNLDAAGPEARRHLRSSRSAALRQERTALESAARRRQDMNQHLSHARIMGMERRLFELQTQGSINVRRAHSPGAPSEQSPAEVNSKMILESERDRFKSFLKAEAPRLARERSTMLVETAERLRSEREALEARRVTARQEFAMELEIRAAVAQERDLLQAAYQAEESDKQLVREMFMASEQQAQPHAPPQATPVREHDALPDVHPVEVRPPYLPANISVPFRNRLLKWRLAER